MLELFTTHAEGLKGPVAALLQVLMIDLILAGDNAVAVGLAAGGLPAALRRKVILYGLGAAVVLRIGFALITTWLLGITGLLLAGGLLLLWVCWRMWAELREQGAQNRANAAALADGDPATQPTAKTPKTFRQAFVQVLIADISMSLDNVLAVAGAAREHPGILALGLLVSIALMGLAANGIATLLNRFHWIGYAGLAIVLFVAGQMVWEGHRRVVVGLHGVDRYNAMAPSFLDISPAELAEYRGG